MALRPSPLDRCLAAGPAAYGLLHTACCKTYSCCLACGAREGVAHRSRVQDLRAELGCALRKAATDWYEELMLPVRETVDMDDRLYALVLAVNKLLVGLQASRTAYDNMFHSVTHVPYFCITFKQVEKLVSRRVVGLYCSWL